MNSTCSFIVPTFNSERTLASCLQSILSQEIPGGELIVVDDSSTDSTITIAEEYASFIIRKDRRSGPARSRNLGWKQSRGNVIIFVDSDVYLPKGWKGKILPLLNQYDAIVSTMGPTDPHDVSFASWQEAADLFVIKRQVLKAVGGYSEIFPYAAGEDSDLLIRILKRGFRVTHQPVNYIHDRQYSQDTLFARIYKRYLWMFLCNLKNADVPRCREFIFVKIPLKLVGQLDRYKEFKGKAKGLPD